MYKINSRFVFPMLALVILIYALSTQMFGAPPFAKLLDPFTGAVQNDQDKYINKAQVNFKKIGITDSARVYFDERKVPHIYAKNSGDLYFLQGYVTASLRLWQMDFISYASAGRLAEIIDNEDILKYDRNQRRLGILEVSRESLKMMLKDSVTSSALKSYTKGVNAYIKRLSYKSMPVEYKLLGYTPEPWSELKTVLILKTLGNTLSGYEEDMPMSKIILALGQKKFNELFPDFISAITPVMNNPIEANRQPLPIEAPPYLNYSFLTSANTISKSPYNPKLGSNSWAVAGNKTKSGFPILANDPHLNLSLPCIWLEMQLSCPGMNVYGVSIPGTPAIIIGFNENIAWGITNGADDVKDWYKMKITDDYKRYELDGKWRDLDYRTEKIKWRGHATITDTIYYTIYGPLVSTKGYPGNQPEFMNYALKWELLHPSNEFHSFIKLNQANNYNDYKQALTGYACPILNFTFACKDNTISIDHTGRMAIKKTGQGKFLLDGTVSEDNPAAYIPQDSLPHLLNPSTSYVLSANQHPTFPGYRYYYNGYFSETRANRINELLKDQTKFDIDKMKSIQLDNVNMLAREAIPILLKTINQPSLKPSQITKLQTLKSWGGYFDLKDEDARLFDLWFKNIKDYTWDEFKYPPLTAASPNDYVLLDLIQNNPGNEYFDIQGTQKNETATDIVTEAFLSAFDEYSAKANQPGDGWGNWNKINIVHIANIPSFSVMNLSSAGNPEAINAMSSNWGPSWRMIVELGNVPRAYGIYPGGQSGNPGSRYYDNFIRDWNQGKYYELHYYTSAAEALLHSTSTWIFT